MQPSSILRLAVALLMPSLVSSVSAQTLRMIKSDEAQVIFYSDQHAYIVPHLTRCFHNAYRFHKSLFGYTPREQVTVFLHDFNDYGSGGTATIPYNYLSIGIEPFDYAYETMPTNERMNWLMNHELAHLMVLDKPSAGDRFFRSLFSGKVYPNSDNPISGIYSFLASPRRYSPRWYHEGIAVFLETWMAGGMGRVLGGYDEMVFRAMVRDSAYFYDIVGLESEGTTIDFQIGQNSYLYGTRFISYMGYEYGPGKLITWFSRNDSSSAYYAHQFERVYGRTLEEAWGEWIAWEQSWQQGNIDSIRQYPVTTGRPVLPEALGSVSRSYFDSGTNSLYSAINYPGQLAALVRIDVASGKITRLHEVKTPALYYVTPMAFDSSSRTIFYCTDNSQGFRDIRSFNIETGVERMLLEDCRIGDLVYNPADRSLWGVRHQDGKSTIVAIDEPYTYWYPVLDLPYGKDIFDIDISPDGTKMSGSLIEISGRQTLVLTSVDSLRAGTARLDTLFEFANNAPSNFVFTRDGRSLIGTSYFTGVSNVFRIDIATRNLEALSNCESGFFRPIEVSGDSLLVYEYTGKGFLPVVIPAVRHDDVSAIRYLGQAVQERNPEVRDWMLGSPLTIDLDSVVVQSGEYHLLSDVRLGSMYPIVQGYKHTTSVGLRANFTDPLGVHNLDLSGSYSPTGSLSASERLHATVAYQYAGWRFAAGMNAADFYDLFGPTTTSRKGYSLSLRYTDYLLYDRPTTLEYSFGLSGYAGLERLPEAQNVVASFDRFMVTSARLAYYNVRRSLGSVDDEEGIKLALFGNSTYVNRYLFPKIYTNLDYGFLLPIDHSSLWLRLSGGLSFGKQNSSFAFFYFGAFGNNWIDFQSTKRYRDYYSFPGIEINEVGGYNYGKLMLEWTLPPLRFRRLGFPAAYCTWARLALFSSLLTTNMKTTLDQQTLVNVGAQVDFRLVTFSNLESALTFGYALAFERGLPLRREFMVSYRIM